MEKVNLYELAEWTGSKIIHSGQNLKISEFSTDSRTIKEGDFFIPLKGLNFDGHNFIDEAVSKGATGFVYSKDFSDAGIVIQRNILAKFDEYKKCNSKLMILECEDTNKFLIDAAKHYLKKFNPISIGITGSVGKTTTKNFLVNILKSYANTVYSKKSFNNEIGIPKSIFEVNNKTNYFIAELGMRGKGQVRELSDLCNIKYGILTKIGPSHLQFFKDINEIVLAKTEMSEKIKENNGFLVLNGDEEYIDQIKSNIFCDTVICGSKQNFEYNFSNIEYNSSACFSFDINNFDKKIMRVSLLVAGFHNIYNAILSAALALKLNIEEEVVKNAIENTTSEYLRMQLKEINGKYVIIDCYNANPMSLKSAIDTLRIIASSRNARSVAILGDMLELGEDSDKYHAEIGEYLFLKNIDFLMTFGLNSRYTFEKFNELSKGGNESLYFKDKEMMVKALSKVLKENDVILIKGSRANCMEDIINFI